jgi:hypothetical protein
MALLPLEAIRDGVQADPSIYPQAIDLARQAILFLRLNEQGYRAASFLDDRMLTPQSEGRWTPLPEAAALLDGLRPQRPLHFIFHAGHVGSTLLSRLLDEAGGVLGLREPLPLRTLAAALPDVDQPHALAGPAQWQTLLQMMIACWGRGYADTRAVVVKATSSASPCAAPLLKALPSARAVALSLAAEPYLATLLAGENSPLDLRGQAPERMKRLQRLAPGPHRPLHALRLGEIAALTWAVETLTHITAVRQFGARVLRVDFDAFLAAPGDGLRAVLSHFAIDAPDAFLDGVAHHPVMTRYSKATEHAYSPETRCQILAQSRARHGEDIRAGLGWIEALVSAHPALGADLA